MELKSLVSKIRDSNTKEDIWAHTDTYRTTKPIIVVE